MKAQNVIRKIDSSCSAGASIAEALLLVSFCSLFVVAGLNIFSKGVTYSYCKAALEVASVNGGGTDEATEGESGTDRSPDRRRRSDLEASEISIQTCVATARGARGVSGGGRFGSPR